MPKKVLLIDDDRQMLAVTRRYLENLGFTVVFTDNGSEALMLAKDSRPDVIVTDVDMPGLNGLELCKAVKTGKGMPPVPVIIISGSKVEDDDIISGYDKGADDYLIKPFSFPVLAAKINAVLRRYTACDKNNSARISKLGLVIDPASRAARLENKVVNLTRKEFDLLTLFLEKQGRVLSVPYMLETVWGYDPANYNDPHTVEVHISSLRKKLGRKIAAHILSVTGHGYKFE
jgi:two-component system alkaline phosphatase synthesis response regulator PhoP